ncbi:SpoIIE family protein phosphatase [Streptomyces sp. NPDC021722]
MNRPPPHRVPLRYPPDASASDIAEFHGLLVTALRQAVSGLEAVTGAVYLLNADGDELVAVVFGGTPPALFTMPERMALDAPYASSTAWRTGEVVIFGEPAAHADDPGLARLVPFPYSVASTPVAAGGHRLGALTVARIPSQDGLMGEEQSEQLRRIGDQLAAGLVPLTDRGLSLTIGSEPSLVPVFKRHYPTSPWGLPDVSGSAGLTLTYHVYKLGTALNEAVDVQSLCVAAQNEMMSPCGAQALVLSTLNEDRLWVVGHCGVSSKAVSRLHGSSSHAHSPFADTLRGRDPMFFPDLASLLAHYPETQDNDFDAWAFLPLAHSGRTTGVCCLGFDTPRVFDAEEQAAMMMMAGVLSAALERALLKAHERVLAEKLQRQLLPRMLSDLPGVTTTARYIPAPVGTRVGGDWYDVIRLPGEKLGLVVGDVEGHSIESSVLMGQLRSAVLAHASEGYGPADVLTRASQVFTDLDTELLATCCFMSLDVKNGVGEIALAGHPAPLVCQPDGQVAALNAPANAPLGMQECLTGPYEVSEVSLDPGSLLLFYTDGLAPPRSPDPIAGVQSLLATFDQLRDRDLEKVADRLIAIVQNLPQRRDDAVLLLARYEATLADFHHRIKRMEILRHDLQGVKATRRFIRNTLHSWGLDTVADEIELMASEIVTNALVHADSAVDMRLHEYDRYIRLEVRDSDVTPPVPSSFLTSEEENSQAEHGRGLVIVDTLATNWGSSPGGRGKTVWLEVALQ